MSLPDPDAPRKHRRGWLLVPWTLALILVVGWSAGWFWLRDKAVRQMDESASEMRRAGYTLAWKDREVGGFPFRLEVTLTEVRVAEPYGWGLTAPLLKGEAAAYALEHWMLTAPDGVTLMRPRGGPVAIRGSILRASILEPDRRPPRISVEGVDLTFIPGQGAAPFFLSTAKRLDLQTRAGPDDQGAVLLRVEGAQAQLPGLLARMAEDRPVTFGWEMILSRMSAFTGPDWAGAARAWSAAGGSATVQRASLQAGQAVLEARSGALTVGADGRVRGKLNIDLRQASQAIDAMSQGLVPSAAVAQANIVFTGGETRLGMLAIAPAPRVY